MQVEFNPTCPIKIINSLILFFVEEPVTQQAKRPKKDDTPMEVDEDYNEVITDPAFLQSVLENLPGVDPQSEAIRGAVDSLNKDKKSDKDKDGKSGSGSK